MTPRGVGTVQTSITLFSPDLKQEERISLAVDTGSFLTWVPEEVATRLGLRPTETRRLLLIDGSTIERPSCEAVVECEGIRRSTIVVLARPTDSCVLGVYTLEGLGLEVDPGNQTLRRVDVYLALVTA